MCEFWTSEGIEKSKRWLPALYLMQIEWHTEGQLFFWDTMMKKRWQNVTVNPVTLLNEVRCYQSLQHLLCFGKLYPKHGEAYYLRRTQPVLGAHGDWPSGWRPRSQILNGSFSRNSPVAFLRSLPSQGRPTPPFFSPLLFARTWCSILPAEQKHFKTRGKASPTCSPFPFLSMEQDPSGTLADPLRQRFTPFAWANQASPTTSKDFCENEMRSQKKQHLARG